MHGISMSKSCPIQPMDIPTPIDNRLVDLEIKAGFTEDLLDQLNAQVYGRMNTQMNTEKYAPWDGDRRHLPQPSASCAAADVGQADGCDGGV